MRQSPRKSRPKAASGKPGEQQRRGILDQATGTQSSCKTPCLCSQRWRRPQHAVVAQSSHVKAAQAFEPKLLVQMLALGRRVDEGLSILGRRPLHPPAQEETANAAAVVIRIDGEEKEVWDKCQQVNGPRPIAPLLTPHVFASIRPQDLGCLLFQLLHEAIQRLAVQRCRRGGLGHDGATS